MSSWFDIRGTVKNSFFIGNKKTYFDASLLTDQRNIILPNANVSMISGNVEESLGLTSSSSIGWISKENPITDGAITTILSSNLSSNKIIISSSIGKIGELSLSSSLYSNLIGVNSNIENQINQKDNSYNGAITTIISSNLTINRSLVSNALGKVNFSSISSTILNFLSGVTSDLQAQLNNKIESASNIGGGVGIFDQISSTNLRFKTLIAGPNTTITQNANEINISTTPNSSSFSSNTYEILNSQTNKLVETLTDYSKTYEIFYSIIRGSRFEAGVLQAVPNSGGFQYSTPVTVGPEAGFPTGVTLTFNVDGTITYTSNAVVAGIKTLTIQKNLI
jgi:hypothetical protein